MSRVLPFKRPSLDFSLWEEIRSKALIISEAEKDYISKADANIGSRDSVLWQKGGRGNTVSGIRNMIRNSESSQDGKMVYDFVGLSRGFNRWFDRVNLDPDGLLEEIEGISSLTKGSEVLSDFGDEWLRINWTVLGRAVGSAIANEGRRLRFWSATGSDARMSNEFWMSMAEKEQKGPGGINYVSSEDWDDLVEWFRERDFDPGAEIIRAAGHRPSAPIFPGGSHEGTVYSANPLSMAHRRRMRGRFRDADDAEEFAFFHGELTFKIIRDAMDALDNGEEAKFALIIHGLCSHHMMRTSITQQKIGMHLLSNLAVRKMSRGVVAVPVPDIAQQLATGFSMGKVMQIMHDAGLIEWYTVEVDIVEEALTKLNQN
tara:strand:+ start:5430 stop:6548 length:1119 start_codon:yes stop_codon:yes gene_type:complete